LPIRILNGEVVKSGERGRGGGKKGKKVVKIGVINKRGTRGGGGGERGKNLTISILRRTTKDRVCLWIVSGGMEKREGENSKFRKIVGNWINFCPNYRQKSGGARGGGGE